MEAHFNQSATHLKQKMLRNNWTEILNGICHIINGEIMVDYYYFKHTGNSDTYNLILSHVLNTMDSIVEEYGCFVMHLNVKSLSVGDVDKHQSFLQMVSELFKTRYDGKLVKCYIYHPPFVFKQVFQLVKKFIDPETLQKISVQ